MIDLLLDSHTLLWVLYGPSMLPRSLADLLRNPETHLFISEASIWELADKAGKGRLPLAENSVPKLINDIQALGTTLLPIELADIVASVTLPPHHGDPFDRMFIAQALSRGLTLVTKDAEIARYDVKRMWQVP